MLLAAVSTSAISALTNFHLGQITEVYSNSTGTVQFAELATVFTDLPDLGPGANTLTFGANGLPLASVTATGRNSPRNLAGQTGVITPEPSVAALILLSALVLPFGISKILRARSKRLRKDAEAVSNVQASLRSSARRGAV